VKSRQSRAGLGTGHSVPGGPGSSETHDAAFEGLDRRRCCTCRRTRCRRAKFYVIDVHNHVNDAGGVHGRRRPGSRGSEGDGPGQCQENRHPDRDVGRKNFRASWTKMVKPYPTGSWSSLKWTGAKSAIPISARKWWRSWMMR